MRKGYLLIIMLLSQTFVAFSQGSLEIQPGYTLEDKVSTAGYLEFKANIKNISDVNVRVGVFRSIDSEVAGSENNFCWGTACYPPQVDTCTATQFLTPDAIDTTFVGDYTPKGNNGTSVITYCFYNEEDLADSVCHTVTFEVTTLSISEDFNDAEVDLYPNPVRDVMIFKYDLPVAGEYSLRVFNVIGNQVAQRNINGTTGNVAINANSLVPGVYFYKFMDGSKVLETKKFFVTR